MTNTKKLTLAPEDDAEIGGVAGGIANHFDIDVTYIRLFFIFLVLCGMSGILIYCALYWAMPKNPKDV